MTVNQRPSTVSLAPGAGHMSKLPGRPAMWEQGRAGEFQCDTDKRIRSAALFVPFALIAFKRHFDMIAFGTNGAEVEAHPRVGIHNRFYLRTDCRLSMVVLHSSMRLTRISSGKLKNRK